MCFSSSGVQLRRLYLSSSSQERDSGLGSFPPDQLSLGGAGALASATDGAAGCVRAVESMPQEGKWVLNRMSGFLWPRVGLWHRLHMCGAGEKSASCQQVGDRQVASGGGMEFRTGGTCGGLQQCVSEATP